MQVFEESFTSARSNFVLKTSHRFTGLFKENKPNGL
jgi:hypothetical protein